MNGRPAAIAERHFVRRAIGYARQSSKQQVRENVGSTAIQRDLTIRLHDWGWPSELIELVEDDLGVMGSNPGGRAGFSRLVERMKAGEIGLVAVTQDTRLARNLLDFATFADVARRFDVLVAYGEQVFDLQDPNSEFIATIFGSDAARVSRISVNFSQQTRRKKAEVGIAPTGPPVGYVRRRSGSWVKDPEPRVGEVIHLVFDKFFETGSARGLVRYLRRHDIRLPRKGRDGDKRWVDATYSNVLRFLQNPAYSGVYLYGRTAVDERLDRYPSGKHRFRRIPPGEWIRIPDHHDAYVAPARWAEIQLRLATNRITLIAPPGRGSALVQGLLRCTVHDTAFVTTYPTRRKEADGHLIRQAQYSCRPERHACGSAQHASVMAHRLDAVVEAEVLATLVPPSLELMKQAAREALGSHDALERGRRDELRRLEATAAAAEHALDETGLDQVYVRRRQTERLEVSLRDFNDRKTFFKLHPLTPPLTLTDVELSELRALVNDLPALWRHPHVSAEQRKAVVRTIIRGVYATPGPETWALEIHWAGEARTEQKLLTDTGTQAQLGKAVVLIRSRFAEGASAPQIVQELNASQMGQARGPWTERRVRDVIARLQRGVVGGLLLPRRRSISSRVLALDEAGLAPSEIVARLREEGTTTLRHRPVTLAAVQQALRRRPADIGGRQVTGDVTESPALEAGSPGPREEAVPICITEGTKHPYQLYDHLKKGASLADRFGDKVPRKVSQDAGGLPRRRLGRRGRDQALQGNVGQRRMAARRNAAPDP
jgi:DNA invertase Pin-like site-specific DNA recombinase